MKIESMRARMTSALACSIALLVLLLSAIYLLVARSTLERSFSASLDRIALDSLRLAAEGADLSQLRGKIEEHNSQIAQSGAISEGVEAWLLNGKKEVWRMGPPRPPLRPPLKKDDALPAPANAPTPPDSPVAPLDINGIPPLEKPSDWRTRTLKWGNGTLILGLPWHRARHDLDTQATALGILCLLISGAAACGAWILVGKTLRPIDALAEQARDASHSPLQLMEKHDPLRPTSSDIEMQNLVSTLNQMLENVHEAALSKERFHTSASHELRTPLQALGGHLGVTLARERSAAEYKVALQEAAQQTARLSKLTRDLLLLNRLQTAENSGCSESVDVTEMCDIALQRAEKTIETRHLKLVTQWDSLEIEASPSHVEILLGNLVENAAKYAPDDGQIGIEIHSAEQSVEVWNDCSEEQAKVLHNEIPRLFEPFYRPDSARASDTGGNGLGLAICQSIAEANDWKLGIEAREQKFLIRVIFEPKARL